MFALTNYLLPPTTPPDSVKVPWHVLCVADKPDGRGDGENFDWVVLKAPPINEYPPCLKPKFIVILEHNGDPSQHQFWGPFESESDGMDYIIDLLTSGAVDENQYSECLEDGLDSCVYPIGPDVI